MGDSLVYINPYLLLRHFNEPENKKTEITYRAVARKKLQPRRTHGPLYEISRMKSSNIISLIKKIKIDSIW